MATEITGKPTLAVTGLGSPKRGNNNHVMTATWKVPAAMTKDSSKTRATGLEITWKLGIADQKDPAKVLQTSNESRTTSSVNLNSLTIGSKTYTRQSFYPNTKKKLKYVTVAVKGTNSKGEGKSVSATRKFEKPRQPSISAFSFNESNGRVSCTITTNAGTDYRERYDTRYKVVIKNTRTGKTTTYRDTSSTSTSINVTYDPSDYQQLSYGQYIRVTVSAWSRGYAGFSDTVKKSFYVSYPAQATIKGVDVSSKSSTGKCTVRISTNRTESHPVDAVKLEYLANTTYATSSAIPADAVFTSTDIVDNGACTALACPVADLMPDSGKYTWIRVKSWHASETVLFRYSQYKRITKLETPAPTAADDDIVILSATAGEDGESAVVLLGWNADGQDDSTGTELTWAEEEDTWKSTEAPQSHEFTWSDGSVTSGGVTYRDSATITIKKLTEGTKYYIRARRYLEGDTVSYSNYSNTATVITSETPETVVASCDRYVPSGESLPVLWTFSGNGLQTAWQIVTTDGTVIANGEGSIGATQISAERLAAFATNNTVTFTVQASTGSGFVTSEEHTVTLVDAPTLELTTYATLTAQPYSFTATVSELCDLVVIVTSQGASGQFPDGLKRQTEGDTIYSEVVSPVWTEGTNDWSAPITLPDGLDFWDLGHYTLSVVAIDRLTGLRSDEVTSDFDVTWSHQAVDPYDAVTLTPIDEITEGGAHVQAVSIALTAPTGSTGTDVYDIYRVCGDGAQLIGTGFPLTYTAQDDFAPFGDSDLMYRIAIRTVDGDVEFADIPYELPGQTLRFDWSGGTLELPYDLSIGDSYAKDVEIRNHLNGSADGYWNQNIERKGSFSSDLIRLEQQDEIVLARQLARYTGPVFVRTPDGSAYEADVQITDLSTTGILAAIAVDATEVSLTDEFILPTPYELEE